jgi:uncharacterized DUF497 family protein
MRRVERIEFSAFELNEDKRRLTLRKSGLDLAVVAYTLLSPHIEIESPQNGELRTKAICQFGERLIVVVYTMRESVCRMITAWPADKNEQRQFREIFGG